MVMHGYKQWFACRVAPDLATDDRRYLRTGPGGGILDVLDLASWFATRGEALDAMDAENVDAMRFTLVAISVEYGQLVQRDVPWLV